MADKEIVYLSKMLVQVNFKTILQLKKCIGEFAKRARDKQQQFECAQLEKLEHGKIEARKSQADQVVVLTSPVKSAKLPKLVITKLSG